MSLYFKVDLWIFSFCCILSAHSKIWLLCKNRGSEKCWWKHANINISACLGSNMCEIVSIKVCESAVSSSCLQCIMDVQTTITGLLWDWRKLQNRKILVSLVSQLISGALFWRDIRKWKSRWMIQHVFHVCDLRSDSVRTPSDWGFTDLYS